ncbi:hypothetical protein ICV01_07330 [Polynucleobacter sp. MWH-Spelu-300-X4]|uniref:hypothetical protein n=1 Tax=Polynucleobacter sp. MWH-Spelu-300-X4 TaxID=2689109 RepID=UPI001BFD16B4|nr:hypothetical protein [Polynucleobacter sp. MWH-Spelu-300-X4]QWD79446.1 hypothetical protein ICV01_07330 [Polynucleobacter sp. MWH-Spelu-300-X4]
MAKKPVPFDAHWDLEGVDVVANWRYPLILPYITQSPSFIAVTKKHRGLKVPRAELPKDEKLVFEVAKKFGLLNVEYGFDDFFNIKWWNTTGKHLYGTKHAIPDIEQKLVKAGQTQTVKVTSEESPTIVLQIPTNLTATEAISRIRQIFYINRELFNVEFGTPLPAKYDSEYKLEPSKLRKDTVIKGASAIAMYREGMPLWKIGNQLKISPDHLIKDSDLDMDQDKLAEHKRVLSIMALRLVKTALLIAENAARGRFPLDKPFPQAKLKSYKRPAGRPIGSRRPKRISVTEFKSF